MPNYFSGDSRAIHNLVVSLFQGQVGNYTVQESLANRELERQLLPGGRPIAWDDAIALFPPSPADEIVPFLPNERLLSPLEKEAAIRGFQEAVATGEYTSGPHIGEFESALSEFLGVSHVVATASGTDAMIVALKALGVGIGDEVILPANSYAATENAVFMTGARPVLIDVDPGTATIDPGYILDATTRRTKAVLVVHLHGQLADMRRIADVVRDNGLLLIEDACQAIGVTGVGQLSDAAALSFNPVKTLGTCGKAGAILTNQAQIAQRCRMLACHGFEPGIKNVKTHFYGYNCLIDNVSACIGLQLLPYLGLNIFKRMFLAKRYDAGLQKLNEARLIRTLAFVENCGFALYPVFLPEEVNRDAFRDRLKQAGVATELNYPIISNRQETPEHRQLFDNVYLPNTDLLNRQALCLPLFSGMSLAEQDCVIQSVCQLL